MRLGTQGFDGTRLRQAREARGLFGTDLGRMVGVKSQTISAYEKNKGTPSPQVMQAIADHLGFSVSFFTRAAGPEEVAPIFWRASNAATKAAQGRAEARLEWLKDVAHYLRQFFNFPQPNIPTISLPSDFRMISPEVIEAAAAECRRFWGLGDGPLSGIVGELETNGVVTAQIEVCADKLDAFSQWSGDGTPYVLLGTDKASRARRFFDAAHELGHLILHRSVDRPRVNSTTDWRVLEDQAHRFASALLLPEDAFKREVWVPSVDAFAALKPRWNASIQAMIMRCRDLGIIDEYQVEFLYREVSRRGWRKKEPHDDLPLEEPNLVPNGIRMLVEAGVRKPDQILAELALPAVDLEEITGMPRGYYTAAPAPVVALPTLKPKAEATDQASESGNVVSFDRTRRS